VVKGRHTAPPLLRLALQSVFLQTRGAGRFEVLYFMARPMERRGGAERACHVFRCAPVGLQAVLVEHKAGKSTRRN
jgi:hypothetical protein